MVGLHPTGSTPQSDVLAAEAKSTAHAIADGNRQDFSAELNLMSETCVQLGYSLT